MTPKDLEELRDEACEEAIREQGDGEGSEQPVAAMRTEVRK